MAEYDFKPKSPLFKKMMKIGGKINSAKDEILDLGASIADKFDGAPEIYDADDAGKSILKEDILLNSKHLFEASKEESARIRKKKEESQAKSKELSKNEYLVKAVEGLLTGVSSEPPASNPASNTESDISSSASSTEILGSESASSSAIDFDTFSSLESESPDLSDDLSDSEELDTESLTSELPPLTGDNLISSSTTSSVTDTSNKSSEPKANGSVEEPKKDHADELLHSEALKEKIGWLKANDKEKRREGFDYTDFALKESLSVEGIIDDKAKEILESARAKNQEEIKSRIGVAEGIIEIFEDFKKHNEEIDAAIWANVEDDEKVATLKEYQKTHYNDKLRDKLALQVAVERAEKRAKYLSANDEKYSDKTDYLDVAFEEATNMCIESSTKTPPDVMNGILEILNQARKKCHENKQPQPAKEETVDDRLNAALEEIEKKKSAIEKAKEKFHGDPGLVAVYDEQLKELDKERARTALQTMTAFEEETERAKKRKEEEDKEKKEEAAKKILEELQKKDSVEPEEKPGQPESSVIEPVDEPKVADVVAAFFRKNKLDNERNSNGTINKDVARKNVEKSENVFTEVRPVGSMKKTIDLMIKFLYTLASEIKWDSKNPYKSRKERQLIEQVLKKLQRDINSIFGDLGPSIAIEEEIAKKEGHKGAMWAIKMSELVNRLDDSLHIARSALKDYNDLSDAIKQMQSGLHATAFTGYVRTFLLRKEVTTTDEDGNEISASQFVKDRGYSGYYDDDYDYLERLTSPSGTKEGICYRAVLRTIVNTINMATHFSDNTLKISGIKNLLDAAETILDNESPSKLNSNQVKTSIRNSLHLDVNGKYDEDIRTLGAGNSGTKQSANASKLKEALKLMKKLYDNPSNAGSITKEAKKLNYFSDIIGDDPDRTKGLLDADENSYQYVERA